MPFMHVVETPPGPLVGTEDSDVVEEGPIDTPVGLEDSVEV